MILQVYNIIYYYVVHPQIQYRGTMLRRVFDVKISSSTRRHSNFIE